MDNNASLSESELDELENFLLYERCPESSMMIDTLHGFFTAIVLTPANLVTTHWLRWVWDMDEGEFAPEFETVEEANHILGLIMRYYNSIVSMIDEGQFEPVFMEMNIGSGSEFLDAGGWCEGFIFGVELFSEYWQTLIKKHPALIEPMKLLGTEKGQQTIRRKGLDNPRTLRTIYETIPTVVVALHEYFRPQREWEVATINNSIDSKKHRVAGSSPLPKTHSAKVGRNEPCPCGSGKKYKKCCGMVEMLGVS